MRSEIRVDYVYLFEITLKIMSNLLKNMKMLLCGLSLKKEYFSLPKDIYLGNVYIVPEGSSYLNDDVFHLIKQDIAKLFSDAQVLICGDYNARKGVALDSPVDTVYGNDNNLNEIIPDYCLLDYCEKNILDRHSMDSACKNGHGMKPLEVCKSTGLVIFNGRLGSDKGKREYTRVDTTGCSVVDYFVGSHSVFNMVTNFCVQTKFPESDHRPIECSLRCYVTADYHNINVPTAADWLPCVKYVWCHENLNTIRSVLGDAQSQNHRSAIVDVVVYKSSSDHLARAFDNYIHHALSALVCATGTKYDWADTERA